MFSCLLLKRLCLLDTKILNKGLAFFSFICLNKLKVVGESSSGTSVTNKVFSAVSQISCVDGSCVMLKGVCQFFNTTGKCRFGKHCRFSHIEISETPPPQVEINQDGILSESILHAKPVGEIHSSFISQQTGNNGSLRNQNQPSEGAVSPETNICTFYLKNRFCRYGKRCRYLHVPLPKKPGPKAPRAVTEAKSQDESQKEETQKTEGEKEVQNEIRELNDEFNKTVALPEKASPPLRQGYKKKVCHFFKQGHCRFGKRCQYFHPTGKQNVSDQPKKTHEVKSSQKPADEKSEAQTPQTVAPTFKPPHIQVYNRDTVSGEKLTELRETELRQLKRRFPKDKLEIVEEGSTLSKYTFTFTPTDPDWVILYYYFWSPIYICLF